MDTTHPKLSGLTEHLVSAFERAESPQQTRKITVNALVSAVATWYEKFRNVMDYREEEVILRAAVERILKRRLLLGGSGKTVAAPLVRELVWARYFQDNSLSESLIDHVAERIDLYLSLKNNIIASRHLSETAVNEWIFQLMSSDVEYLLNPKKRKGTYK